MRRLSLPLGLLLSLLPGLVFAADRQKPTVRITTPTQSAMYTTASTHLTLGGTAQDTVAVASVSWRTDQGQSGAATGTTAWQFLATLGLGTTRITVTAVDAAGNRGEDTLTVTVTGPPPPPPPGPITVFWSYDGGTGDGFHMERCTAPQPCPMAPVATIALSDRQWTDTAVQSTLDYCYRLAVVTGGAVGDYSNTLCSP